MFTQDIIFIVGAGASCEFGGLPVGAQLMTQIRNDAACFATSGSSPKSELYEIIRRDLPERLDTYVTAGADLAKHIGSGATSIDDVLTWFTSRPEVVELGKVAIVHQILKGERSSRLYNPANSQMASEIDLPETWLPYFLSMVMDGRRSEEAERAFDKVTIVNFNYDRTIEHFLYSALQSKFGLGEPRARRIVSEMITMRPYGFVGKLPWQEGPGLAFGAQPDGRALMSFASSIKTFSEGFAGNIENQIQLALEKARVCVFLGFGFHTQNMNLFKARAADWRRAYATVFGMQAENHRDISMAIALSVGCNRHLPILLDWRAHRLLWDLRPAIMAAAAM